jgi:hypothetical protein
MKKQQTFESYLQDMCLEDSGYNGRAMIKDNAENDFEEWLDWQGIDNIMDYADKFAGESYKQGQADCLEAIKQVEITKEINQINNNEIPQTRR